MVYMEKMSGGKGYCLVHQFYYPKGNHIFESKKTYFPEIDIHQIVSIDLNYVRYYFKIIDIISWRTIVNKAMDMILRPDDDQMI